MIIISNHLSSYSKPSMITASQKNDVVSKPDNKNYFSPYMDSAYTDRSNNCPSMKYKSIILQRCAPWVTRNTSTW